MADGQNSAAGRGEIEALLGNALGRNYIGGQWVDAQSGKTFETRNPATGELLGQVASSDASDVAAAVGAGAEGVREARWSTPAPKRGEILFRPAQLLDREARSNWPAR